MVEGRRVRLEFDQGNTASGHKDRYGRTLAYVFLEDGALLNAAKATATPTRNFLSRGWKSLGGWSVKCESSEEGFGLSD